MEDMTGSSKVERIAVLVSYNGTSKFLGAPKLKSSTGRNISDVVYQRLVDWDIVEKVKGLSYDTTSVNTGIKSGAVVNLEKKFGRSLMKLPCRHHIYEIILRSVFEEKLCSTSSPQVPIFEKFAKSWPGLAVESFRSGIMDEIVCMKISQPDRENCIKFCLEELDKSHFRDDYKELLQLTLLFLGEGRYNFFKPGATSHARWMSKAIYSFKIFLFRDQIDLDEVHLSAIRDVCIFLVKIYVQAWFKCTNAVSAPLHDLKFIQDVINYSKMDSAVSTVVLKKISHHLWYISEEAVALAFFDSKISLEEKRRMIKNLNCKQPRVEMIDGRHHLNVMDFSKYNLSDFVSEKTKDFFSSFGLPSAFLESDPTAWESSFDYQECWTFCQNLFVVNDTAERGVKFMQDYNKILTHDEEEKQVLLQVVEAYRKKYPSYKKSDLSQ